MHKVKCSWIDKMSFDCDSPGGNIKMDTSSQFGGDGNGLRPKGLMLSALAGCTAMDVVSLAKKMRAQFDEFGVEVEAELSEEHPKMYTDVKVIYTFLGSDLKKDKLKKAVHLSMERYCGVNAMFKSFSSVTSEIIFKTNDNSGNHNS